MKEYHNCISIDMQKITKPQLNRGTSSLLSIFFPIICETYLLNNCYKEYISINLGSKSVNETNIQGNPAICSKSLAIPQCWDS